MVAGLASRAFVAGLPAINASGGRKKGRGKEYVAARRVGCRGSIALRLAIISNKWLFGSRLPKAVQFMWWITGVERQS